MKQKSFTIIELLVVVSIIGLISAITLVTVKNAIERAKIAAGLQFSASIKHALGANTAGEWGFENSLMDTSGNERHGSPNGVFFSDDAMVGDNSLFFDGNGYISTENSGLGLSSEVAQSITIEAWIKPDTFTDTYHTIAVKHNSFYLGFALDKLFFSLVPVDMIDSGDKRFEIGKWYHVVGTYNGSEMKIFANGEEIGSEDDFNGNRIDSRSDPLLIGIYYYNNFPYYPFYGLIDEVRIYGEGLSSTQIKKLYVEGVRKRGLLTKE